MNSFSKTMTAIVKKFPPVLFALVLSLVASSAFALLPQPAYANPDPGWYDASWAYRKKITIDHTKVPNTNQNNFPVLINRTDTDWKDTANDGHVAQSDGGDILFTNSSGTKLDHEIEKYTASTGELIAWVEVDSLSASSDTDIYIYYGNSSLAEGENQWNITGTWDTNYKMVQHLQEDPTDPDPAFKDSTSNSNNGTDNGAMTSDDQVTGQIDGSIDFDGTNDNVRVSDSASLDISPNITTEMWIKPDSPFRDLVLIHKFNAYAMAIWNDGSFGGIIDPGGAGITVESGEDKMTAGTWNHIVFRYEKIAEKMELFLNGTNVGTMTYSDDIRTSNIDVFIGSDDSEPPGYACFFDGTIDEVRISNKARSADWIKTSYNNQNSPSTFYSVGSEQTPPTANVGADQTVCAGVNLALNGNPSGGSGTYTSHSWTGDTAPLSATNVVNPTFNSATPGTYNLTYTVTDSNGCQGSDSLTVTVNPASLHHFTFDTISSPQTAGVSFSITITAKDEFGNTVTGYTATNSLTDTTGTISPTTTTAFTNGVWTGNVTITKAQTGVQITTTGDTKSGTSNSFDVNPNLPFTATITADPVTITADGSSTSTITATVKDEYDNPVADGTEMVFTTNLGTLGSSTVTKTTVSGVATATLTSSTEPGIATVKAAASNDLSATAVFFIGEGDTEVEASKTEITSSGDDTVDAKTEADTEVEKSGTGTPAITVAKYSSNPGRAPAFTAVNKYIDVHIDDTTNVDEIIIKVYYTEAEIEGLNELALITHWWDGSTWVSCSDSGVTYPAGGPTYRGFMWAEIRADTYTQSN